MDLGIFAAMLLTKVETTGAQPLCKECCVALLTKSHLEKRHEEIYQLFRKENIELPKKLKEHIEFIKNSDSFFVIQDRNLFIPATKPKIFSFLEKFFLTHTLLRQKLKTQGKLRIH